MKDQISNATPQTNTNSLVLTLDTNLGKSNPLSMDYEGNQQSGDY